MILFFWDFLVKHQNILNWGQDRENNAIVTMLNALTAPFESSDHFSHQLPDY